MCKEGFMKTTKRNVSLWRKILKATTCHLTIFTLITSPVVLAQESNEQGNQMQNIMGFISGVGGFATDILQQQAALQAQAQTAQMMASLHPQNQMVPSKYFPQCPVLKAQTDFPTGICESAPQVGDQAGVAQLSTITNLAVDFGNEISKLLATNQNAPDNQLIGIQCIERGMEEVDKQLQQRIDSLQAQIDQVKKANQLFKDQNRKILEEMDIVKGDLYGGHTSEAEKNKDYITNYLSDCKNIFGQEANAEAISNGLDGLRIRSDIPNQTASRAIADESVMRARALKQLEELDKLIKRNGVGSYLDANAVQAAMSSAGNSTNFQVAGNLITNKATLFRSDIAGISDALDDIGFQFSESDLDRNFKNRFEDFAANAHEYFKKEAVSKCVSGEEGGLGLGLTTDQILRSLRIKGVSDNQTSLKAFRAELSSILESDAFISEKISAIQALDNKFGVGEVYLSYTNATGQQVRSTTYGLYKAQIEACENKINNESTTASRSSDRLNRSYQERIDRASEAIQKAVQLEKNYRVDLRKSLFERIVNCEGIELREQDCTYSSISNGGGVLSDNNPNYCISNATSCAQSYNSCQNMLNTVVENKKAEMRNLASRFNANVSGLIAQQEAFLNRVKTQALADVAYLREIYPMASYNVPEDLFVKLPEEIMVDQYGVALRWQGDMNQADDLPVQLNKLKNLLAESRSNVANVLAEYAAQQQAGMEREKRRWDTLARSCKQAEGLYNQAVAEYAAQQQEQQQATGSFCRRYNRIAQNPAAGCGSASALAEDASNISQAVDPNATDLAMQYVSFCDSVQNESRNDADSGFNRAPASLESNQKTPQDIYQACSKNNWDWSQVSDGNIQEIVGASSIDGFQGKYDENVISRILERNNDNKEEIAAHYCRAFGREYSQSSCSEPDSSKVNPCQYIVHLAYEHNQDANSVSSATDKYLQDVAGVDNSSFQNDSFLRDVGSSYASYIGTGTNSPSGRIGEQMRRTPCLATNNDQLGESAQTDNPLQPSDNLIRIFNQ